MTPPEVVSPFVDESQHQHWLPLFDFGDLDFQSDISHMPVSHLKRKAESSSDLEPEEDAGEPPAKRFRFES